jgi:hypothetical protein
MPWGPGLDSQIHEGFVPLSVSSQRYCEIYGIVDPQLDLRDYTNVLAMSDQGQSQIGPPHTVTPLLETTACVTCG